ncbi:MAG: cytochrome c oxidase subunit II [Rhodospirillales bacterium]|nr:cytochrome c oxidase subunit II [Acetobacter sp.]
MSNIATPRQVFQPGSRFAMTMPLRPFLRRCWACLPLLFAFGLLLGFAPQAHAELRDFNMWWAPQAVTTGGHQTDLLMMVIFWLTFFMFIVVTTTYIVFIVKYRHRKGVKAVYSHGNNSLELIWTATPAAIFIILALWSDRVWLQLRGPAPKNALPIDIVAYQFGFHVRNPGADGKLGKYSQQWIEKGTNDFGVDPKDAANRDDYASENQLTLPVGRPISVVLRSEDVIHAFYVPEFRMYQDIVPGREIDWVWFTPEKTGHYALACNQLCGNGHYNMQAKIDVVSQEDYAKLVAEKSANAIKTREDQEKGPAAPPAPAASPAAADASAPSPVVAAINH